MWETGYILKKLGWSVLVLIPKGNADTQVIRMIEVVWKVAEAAIDTLIKSVVQFHDALHGFCTERGTRTIIMELRLAQELESVDQDPLFLVFLDLRKAYEKIYRGRLTNTLEGYGAGLKLQGLLKEFWSRQEVVTRQNGFNVPQL